MAISVKQAMGMAVEIALILRGALPLSRRLRLLTILRAFRIISRLIHRKQAQISRGRWQAMKSRKWAMIE
jgi:hypothetical protein